jgi:hypothetical protein
MIQTQIFNTPTGDVYKPADRIERSLARTGNILEKGIREQYDRDMEQQQQFMSLYSNIGEIEGVLQQQYAGINQQMVDSTKNFMAEHYKNGGKATDPEFRMKLGEMTGRLRGGMAQADNNLKQLKPFAEMLKASPYIPEADKPKVLAEVMTLATNPDYLISRNPVDFMSIGKKYERPELILKTEADSFKTNGTYETVGLDKNGNQIRTSVLLNDFTDPNNPRGEDGRINVTVPPEYLQKALNGELRPEVLEIYEKLRKQNYSNFPADVGMGMAIQEGLKNTMTGNAKVSVVKTAQQLADEEENQKLDRQNTRLSIALKNADLLSSKATGNEEQEYQTYFNQFVDSVTKRDKSFLAQYSGEKIKDLDYAFKVGDKEIDEKKFEKIQNDISSKWMWEKLTPERRREIGDLLGVEFSRDFGVGKPLTKEGYDKVKEAMSKTAARPVVKFKERETTSDGMYNWSDREFSLADGVDMETAFVNLEKLNMSGAKPKQKIPTVNTQGGLNYSEK